MEVIEQIAQTWDDEGAAERRSPRAHPVPPPPASLEEAGLSEELVAGLVLKALYGRGSALGFDLVDMLALPMSLLDDVLRQLQEQRLVEVRSTRGPRRGEYVFKLTGAGRERAAEELEVSRYVGPAPVPFEDFCRWVELQAIEHVRVSEEQLLGVLDGVVVPRSLLDLLGPAVNSGRSLFLHGAPGDGKTLLSERIAQVFGERYYVPYAVLVDGSVMIVHDPVHHRAALADEASEASPRPSIVKGAEEGNDGPSDAQASNAGESDTRREIVRLLPEHDRRFAEARRPVVMTGGELTLDQLDLRWDPSGRMYQAPPQLKAAGGVLVVDDLGRQRVPVQDLLNRWVVPLERRKDYLTLRSGKKVVVPFDCFVIFSTNLEPRSLTDEAFLRRIHYKIEVTGPCRDEYERIFRACCAERDIPFDEHAVEYLFREFYAKEAIEPRRCHPRDILDHLRDLASYRGEPPRASAELLGQACRSYFVPARRGSSIGESV
jgi:DNA-binding MarR family transcriptional regulator